MHSTGRHEFHEATITLCPRERERDNTDTRRKRILKVTHKHTRDNAAVCLPVSNNQAERECTKATKNGCVCAESVANEIRNVIMCVKGRKGTQIQM